MSETAKASETGGYPILLHLQDKQVAVIGGGRVAERKTARLLAAGARVLLISPTLTDELDALAQAGRINWIAAAYERDMLNDYMPLLVIAATDDQRVNQTVAQDAHRIRALCNMTDGSSAESDFSNMALIEQPPLTIALSAQGKSPALLRLLKARLTEQIGEEYALLAAWLGGIRGAQKQRLATQAERQRLYEALLASETLPLLRAGELAAARQVFDAITQGSAP